MAAEGSRAATAASAEDISENISGEKLSPSLPASSSSPPALVLKREEVVLAPKDPFQARYTTDFERRNIAKKLFEDSPVQIGSVSFVGLKRSNERLIREFISDVTSSKTFPQLQHNLANASWRLSDTEMFKAVDYIQSEGDDGKMNVTYYVQEMAPFRPKFTLFGSTDQSVSANASGLYNLFGHGEHVKGVYKRKWNKDDVYKLSCHHYIHLPGFLRAMGSRFPPRVSYELARDSTQVPKGSHSVKRTGLTVGVDASNDEAFGQKFEYSFAVRDITQIAKGASYSVCKEEGLSVKSSLAYSLNRDTRDCRLNPTTGYMAGLQSELAGLGGDAKFFKQTAQLLHYTPLPWGLTWANLFDVGWLCPLYGTKASITDRLFINSFRGFEYKGVGPVDRVLKPSGKLPKGRSLDDSGDSVGGTAKWSLFSCLNIPLRQNFLANTLGLTSHLHLYANVGSLVDLQNPKSKPSDLWSLARASVGASLSVRLPFAYNILLEGMYNVVLRRESTDLVKDGLGYKIGFGLTIS
eukprot:gnl/Hemi2/8184_TR2817_c0_g1_i1.p1 gnl/Hemi2/8184_TR2817_c0_g1~~gnl/Hemi2/8184_TR2817_c0_g1_i1.p1  ORF type:complete len:523 (-),score=93.30 gnl/Hemi2/8184_TR2817_c0_g1_i1:29-1597(-)